MRRRFSAQARRAQRRPLTARAQHVKNRIGTLAIRDARSSAAKAVGIGVFGQYSQQDRPQGIRYPKVGRPWVIRRSGVGAFNFFSTNLCSCHFVVIPQPGLFG